MSSITKETFKEADTNTKLDILFDYIKGIHDGKPKCEERFKKLENRKLRDTTTAGIFGFVGGFVAVLGKKFLGIG